MMRYLMNSLMSIMMRTCSYNAGLLMIRSMRNLIISRSSIALNGSSIIRYWSTITFNRSSITGNRSTIAFNRRSITFHWSTITRTV